MQLRCIVEMHRVHVPRREQCRSDDATGMGHDRRDKLLMGFGRNHDLTPAQDCRNLVPGETLMEPRCVIEIRGMDGSGQGRPGAHDAASVLEQRRYCRAEETRCRTGGARNRARFPGGGCTGGAHAAGTEKTADIIERRTNQAVTGAAQVAEHRKVPCGAAE